MTRLIYLTLCLLSCISVYANDSIPNARDYFGKQWIDKEIDEPESLETNLDSLLRDWHIKTYKPIEQNCDCDSIDPYFSDSTIMKRLADIPTVIPMTYNSTVRRFIDVYAVRKRKQMEAILGLSQYYFPFFEDALEKYQLPLELKYLPVVESALNPNAISRVGATGLWQFMFGTGKIYGLEINTLVDERRDPIKASYAAARYLKDLYSIFGDWQLTIAAYNCGPGNVNKAIRRSGGKRDYWDIYYYLPQETRGYVPLFIAANYVMNDYKAHKLCPLQMNLATHIDTMMLSEKVHFDQISGVIGISKAELKSLNPQYRQEIIPGSPEHPYALCIPAEYTLTYIDYEDSIPNYHADELLNTNLITAAPPQPPVVKQKPSYDDYRVYKVRRGDTLLKIANRNRVSVIRLKRWNNIRSSRVHPGQRLRIY